MNKCKSKLKRFAAAAVVSALLLSCPQTATASYNDERFEVYVNMNNKVTDSYVVPNLYRQDSAYAYVKKFPLVVSDGIEYVPISMFSLFSYISVTYSKTSDNFYMTNDKNKKYISFDVTQNIAESNGGEVTEMQTKIFYQTRYLPARKVAEVLGTVYCESYDDPKSGIYAFRICDKAAKLSFYGLLDRYLPKKREDLYKPFEPPTKEENNPEVIEPPVKDPPQNEEPPKTEIPEPKPDPYESIAARDMYFVYTDFNAEYAKDILKRCKSYRNTVSFSMTYDDIFNNPETVRSIAVGGHKVVLTLAQNEDSPTTYSPRSLAEELDKANTALYKITKQKTRLCYVPENLIEGLSESQDKMAAQAEFYEKLKELGYIAVTFNCSPPQSFENSYTVYNRVLHIITSAFPNNRAQKCVMQLKMTKNSNTYTGLIFEFMVKYDQFNARPVNLFMF